MTPCPPGPASNSWFGNLPELTRDWLGTMADCTRRYGPVVRFQTPWPLKPMVLLTEPADIEQVLKDAANYRKGNAQRIGAPILGNGLILSEGDAWRRQRRMAVPAFHRSKIASYAQAMHEAAEALVDGWRDGATHDVLDDTTRMSVCSVARTLFGSDGSGAAETAALGLADAMTGFDAYFNSRFPVALPLPTRSGLRIQRAARRLEKVVYRFIGERRAASQAGVEHDDLLTMLLKMRDEQDGSAFNERELRDMAINLFGAGFETSAVTLAWTFYLLARHPEVAERVRREVLAVAGNGPLTIEHQPKLVFTERVIKESMRIFPAAWLVPREALRDVEIGGFHVARGTQILICTYLVHHDARWYPDPERFDPDRWTEDFTHGLPKLAYLPFGGGPRTCIGNGFAMLGLLITTAAVARRVRFELGEHDPRPPRVSFMLRPRGGVRLRVHRLHEAAQVEKAIA